MLHHVSAAALCLCPGGWYGCLLCSAIRRSVRKWVWVSAINDDLSDDVDRSRTVSGAWAPFGHCPACATTGCRPRWVTPRITWARPLRQRFAEYAPTAPSFSGTLLGCYRFPHTFAEHASDCGPDSLTKTLIYCGVSSSSRQCYSDENVALNFAESGWSWPDCSNSWNNSLCYANYQKNKQALAF